jgi:hypothetical protein
MELEFLFLGRFKNYLEQNKLDLIIKNGGIFLVKFNKEEANVVSFNNSGIV